MEITITINTDNDAFHPDPTPEVARILRDLATHGEREGTFSADRLAPTGLNLRDINGNNTGAVTVTP